MSTARLRAAIWLALEALEDGATYLAGEILLHAVEGFDDPDDDLGAYPGTLNPTRLGEASSRTHEGTAAP
jgi:hypothetical protein